ncbi:MAG: UDP-N-acetylglucosamine 2-epimerase [Bacteroides sp.]|uniref:UDP-N-acetylglucosamine 2-epimerase n=1 Tax=Bacteroides sp. TaxID=29523 RepID=UPI002FCA4885
MKKVCVVTAARSEYGLLRWLLNELRDSKDLQLQLLVTGGHLSPEQGLTYKQIERDGFVIDKKIEFLLSSQTAIGIAKSMGVCMISIADALNDLSPDLLVVLGDRYELLPICSCALIMRVPIAHISGGDVTEGAIDDQIRNAVTMMSTLHFPGNNNSAMKIIEMIGSNVNVYAVGEPGLDSFVQCKLMNRQEIGSNLCLDLQKKWLLVTFHPETKESIDYNINIAKNIIDSLLELSDVQVVITQANADLGGVEINDIFRKASISRPDRFKFYSSLGQLRYLSFMKEAFCVIGNSSSGIVEAPFLGKPVLNIGKRQLGRHICHNILNVSGAKESIRQGLSEFTKLDFLPDHYYGDGMTSKRIFSYIYNFLLSK